MSTADMYRKMVDEYVSKCWLTMDRWQDVSAAVDKFVDELGGGNQAYMK